MKRKKEGEDWYGKISYQDREEELDDPTTVEKKIREGTTINAFFLEGKVLDPCNPI